MQIGIDLGGSHIAVAVISKRNLVVAKREKNIENSENIFDIKQYIVDNIKKLITQVLKDIGAPSCVISKIGISAPGKIKNNIIYDMYNLGIKEFSLVQILSEHYGVEVVVRNDAKCAALVEKKIGNLKDYDDCVFLCLGTGIGGATFINGRMLEYTKEWGSEYGHMIIQKNGIECKCGNKGCFEKYASMKAFKSGIINLLNLDSNISSEDILEILLNRVNEKDREISKYIDEYIENLIIGISNIINILGPEAICIGGSFVYYEKILYTKLLEKMNLKNYNGVKPKILLAKTQNDAGMIGALIN